MGHLVEEESLFCFLVLRETVGITLEWCSTRDTADGASVFPLAHTTDGSLSDDDSSVSLRLVAQYICCHGLLLSGSGLDEVFPTRHTPSYFSVFCCVTPYINPIVGV